MKLNAICVVRFQKMCRCTGSRQALLPGGQARLDPLQALVVFLEPGLILGILTE